ncbi:Yqey-like protein-domain-containing protein [Trametes elegans]|nr:Yqey-like protein-domain-containing protein [Trametes elegans]
MFSALRVRVSAVSRSARRVSVCVRALSTAVPSEDASVPAPSTSHTDSPSARVPAAGADVRARLMQELKQAMKTRDTVKSTTIRSVLSEVYAADKAVRSGTATPSAVASIIRKAAARRSDAAAEFHKAARADLASKEEQEAALLQSFLPPLLPASEIDRVLADVLASPAVADAVAKGPAQRAQGQVFKAFYARVDRSAVDADLVKQRAQALLAPQN